MIEEGIQIFEQNLSVFDDRDALLKQVSEFGMSTMSRSHNNMLSVRLVDLEKGGGPSSDVINSLADLNIQIKDLDPSSIDFAKSGILVKFFNPARKYFNKYQKADIVVGNIIESLDIGKKSLENDNITLKNTEKQSLLMNEKLIQDVESGMKLDEKLQSQVNEAKLNGDISDDKIIFVEEEVLFLLRQRIMDMQQMITVNQQGILSINIIRKNNEELIRSVVRAKNVTVTALTNGVMIASALYSQNIVLDKISILNETTDNLIANTSRMTRDQGVKIQKQATSTMRDPKVFQDAFMDAMYAMEDISKYKIESLPQLQQSINHFNNMASDAQKIIDKITESENQEKILL